MPMSRFVENPCSIFKTKRSTEQKTGQQIYVWKWLLLDKGKNLKLLVLVCSDLAWKPKIGFTVKIIRLRQITFFLKIFRFAYYIRKERNVLGKVLGSGHASLHRPWAQAFEYSRMSGIAKWGWRFVGKQNDENSMLSVKGNNTHMNDK